jgi:O-antigen ligase
MMVASDYKFRHRLAADLVSGSVDIQVIVEIFFYALCAAWLVLRVAEPPVLRPHSRLMTLLWIYGGVIFISASWSIFPNLAAVRGTQMLVLCGVAQAIHRRAPIRTMHAYAQCFCALVTASIFLGLALPIHRPGVAGNRFSWLYVHPVISSSYTAIAVTILVAFLCSPMLRADGLRWSRNVYVGMLSVCILGLLLSQTRGSIAGAVVGVALVVTSETSRRRKPDLVITMAMAVTLVAATASGPISKFIQRGDTKQLTTLSDRTNLWSEAFHLWQLRPLQGYGVAATRGLFLATIGLGGGHNAFIEVLTDTGLLGVVPWAILIVAVMVSLWQLRQLGGVHRRDSTLLLGVMVTLLVNSITTEGLGEPATMAITWFAVTVGWIGVLRRTPAEA